MPISVQARSYIDRQRAAAEQEVVQVERNVPRFSCPDKSTLIDLTNLLPISLSLIETDIREALLELSAMTGISIVADDMVEGLISANLNEQSLESSLRTVLAPGGFSYKKMQDYIFVGSSSPESQSFHLLSTSCNFRPQYIRASQISSLLSPYYRQFMTFNDEYGLVTVIAPATIQQRMQKDLLNLDRRPRQVLLEMTIIEVSSDAMDILGINWDLRNRLGNGSSNTSVNVGGSTSRSNINVSSYVSTLSAPLLDALGFLEANGKAHVRSKPSIVTLDGRMAQFSSLENVWLGASSEAGKDSRVVSYGVMMKIIPYIAEDNSVRLDIISASVSDLVERNDGEPKVIEHSISNTVRVASGRTLVLGGLLHKTQRTRQTQLPLLGNIPGLGWLFKQREKFIQESEVLIVITPRVLNS
ncbi:MAG: hypothetical protein COB33_008510 [Thiotrichaceae bacterium]|nr:hypothetical protein [Thiotrichaceae bacterium]